LFTNDDKIILQNTIAEGIKEVLRKGLRIEGNSLGKLEDELSLFMKALQFKGRIYDFAVMITYNEMFNFFEGKIAYSLVNTENMPEEDKNKFEDLITFEF